MARLVVVSGLVLIALAASPAAAGAQEPASTSADTTEADAHYLRDVGAGLTLGGIGASALGVGLMFGIGGFENTSGLIVGGLFEGIGGVLGVIGIPTWIVGGIRSDVLSHPENERSRVGWSYELAGMVMTLASIAACLVGGALIAAAYGLSTHARGPADDDLARSFVSAGGTLIPISHFIATFLGAPIWAEGARF